MSRTEVAVATSLLLATLAVGPGRTVGGGLARSNQHPAGGGVGKLYAARPGMGPVTRDFGRGSG